MPDGSLSPAPEVFPVLSGDSSAQKETLEKFVAQKRQEITDRVENRSDTPPNTDTEKQSARQEAIKVKQDQLSALLAEWMLQNFSKDKIWSQEGMDFGRRLSGVAILASFKESHSFLHQLRAQFLEQTMQWGDKGPEMRNRWDGAMTELAGKSLVKELHRGMSSEKALIESREEWDAGKIDFVWAMPTGENTYQLVCFQSKSRNNAGGECVVDVTGPDFRKNIDMNKMGMLFDSTDLSDDDAQIMRETAAQIKQDFVDDYPGVNFLEPKVVFMRTSCGKDGMVDEALGRFKVGDKLNKIANQLVDIIRPTNNAQSRTTA